MILVVPGTDMLRHLSEYIRDSQPDEIVDVEDVSDVRELAPGWVVTRGLPSGRCPGTTALAAARDLSKSVIMGGTYKTASVSSSIKAQDGEVISRLCAIEIGDSAFAVVRVDGEHVRTDVIAVRNGRFIVEGVTYGGPARREAA